MKILSIFYGSIALILLSSGSAYADCRSNDSICKRGCLTDNFGDLMGQMKCNLECGEVTIQCFKDENSNNRSNSYTPPASTYRNRSYEKPRYEAPARQTSRRSRSTYNSASETRAPSAAEISRAGTSQAKRCVSFTRDSSGLAWIRNNCSKTVNYGWCYPRYSREAGSMGSAYKCYNGGKFRSAAAASVQPGQKKFFQGSRGAQVSYGVCMKDVQLNGKTYSHSNTELVNKQSYRCKYSSYGR